jgi:hypothetical protein
MRKYARVLILAALLAGGCKSEPPAPAKFTSPEGGFSILVPATLQAKTQDVVIGDAKLTVHAFVGGTDLLRFFVSYMDTTDQALTEVGADDILRQAEAQLVGSNGAVITSDAEVSLDGFPGREVTFDSGPNTNPELSVKARIFLVDLRLYEILVAIPKGDVSTVANNAYLQSFQLLPR